MPSCDSTDVQRFVDNLTDYDSIFYKSLAKNDHHWADAEESHQSGVLIPRRYVGFFGLHPKGNQNTAKSLEIGWFFRGDRLRRTDMKRTWGHPETSIRYYCGGNRASRPEVHLTCVYNPYFTNLQDGAYLVIGRTPTADTFRFDALIVDVSRSALLSELKSTVDIPDGSLWGIDTIRSTEATREFLDYEITPALQPLLQQKARSLYHTENTIPGTLETSNAVWEIIRDNGALLREHVQCPGLAQSKSPFETILKNAPGNLARWALQKAEFQLVRVMEGLHYPELICSELRRTREGAPPETWDELTDTLGDSLEALISNVKSLTQSRRSRAGNSFEWHIHNLLEEYNLSFDRQVGDRRIDFVVQTESDAVELSAKTTTRERWKQLHDGVYFITLDREVSPEKLQKIRERGIRLVVPQKDEDELAHYEADEGVLTFSTFFNEVCAGG